MLILDRARIEGRVAGVGHVHDAAELRIRQIVLRRGEGGRLQGRVAGAEAGWSDGPLSPVKESTVVGLKLLSGSRC